MMMKVKMMKMRMNTKTTTKGINVIDFVPVNCAYACDAKGSDLSVK